nr:sigma-70 family RNA polymerase sigma factor [Auraticoccus cholistanensis]
MLLDEVVLLNLPLADSLARRFRHRGEDEEDLVQVARAGLTEAAHRYQPDRGPFAGFAVPTILGVLKRHFRDRGWMVRPPRRCQEVVLSIRKAWPELTQELKAEPTDAQLAEYIGESVEAVCAARQAEQGYRPVAMDLSPTEGVHPESDDTFEISACEARLLMERAIQSLDERERRLVFMRFYEQRTQSDIAAELGTSQMQVSRLLARVMTKLRDVVGSLDDCSQN